MIEHQGFLQKEKFRFWASSHSMQTRSMHQAINLLLDGTYHRSDHDREKNYYYHRVYIGNNHYDFTRHRDEFKSAKP